MSFHILLMLSCFIGTGLQFVHANNTSLNAAQDISINFENTSRNYLLYQPHQLKQGQQRALALVMVLHGGGGNSESMLKRWQNLADEQDFMVVAPRGIGTSRMNAAWNAIGCCGIPMWKQSEDIGFVQAVLAEVKKNQNIDPKHIYITGFSNGGMLTYLVAAQHGADYAAAAVVSGNLFKPAPQINQAVPMLIMHGIQDQVVPFNGGISRFRFVYKAQSKPFSSAQYAADTWAKANGCQPIAVHIQLPDIQLQRFNRCKADVLFYAMQSAGHVWSDGKAVYLPFQQYRHYGYADASRLIWNFFQMHPKP